MTPVYITLACCLLVVALVGVIAFTKPARRRATENLDFQLWEAEVWREDERMRALEAEWVREADWLRESGAWS